MPYVGAFLAYRPTRTVAGFVAPRTMLEMLEAAEEVTLALTTVDADGDSVAVACGPLHVRKGLETCRVPSVALDDVTTAIGGYMSRSMSCSIVGMSHFISLGLVLPARRR